MNGRWPQRLWQSNKLTHQVYEEYLFLCRDGCVSRKRNLDAVRDWGKGRSDDAEKAKRITRIRGNPELYQPFSEIPEVTNWLRSFGQDAMRYAILIVHGKSRAGKTEYAKSLFKTPLEVKIGSLTSFPDAMRRFDRNVHDGIVLDDVRDLSFLVQNQEKLQGKYDYSPEFASTPGGQCAFTCDLYAIPIAATVNNSTAHLDLLLTDDFLSHPDNRVYVQYPPIVARSQL